MIVKSRISIWLCLVLVAGSTCLASAEEAPTAGTTLAILPFENNSVTDRERYDPLGKGLSAMLITDLSRAGTGLKLIERGKIAALLKEIVLSQTGSVDESTAVNAGRILGAQNIGFGSFVVLGDMVRLDARIIKVETSELVMADSVLGSTKQFLELQQALAKKMAESLEVSFAGQPASENSDIDAALYFAQGVEALDAGRADNARTLFAQAVKLDPNYQPQVDQMEGLN